MSIDGRPTIYQASEGLKVNSGHGYLGWTQACVSAVHLADLIEGQEPALPAGLFSFRR